MSASYTGPLRQEPVAIELHNTRNIAGDTHADWLADPDSAEAFVTMLAPRLEIATLPDGPWPTAEELIDLRGAVREALHAIVEGTALRPEALETLNAAACRAPASPRLEMHDGRKPTVSVDYHGASRAEIVLAAIAADAIALVGGAAGEQVRACHAPGCELYYLQDHPRRQWCSNACGNRARQARHYARRREARSH